MADATLADFGAAALAGAIRRRETSAAEVAAAFAARIEDRDAALNAVVVRRLDEAVTEAGAADAALASGQAVGPLHGVPITIKEAIAVAGLPFTNGSRLYADRVADADAAVVRRLRGAGAIVVGKTNVPEFCAWYDTDNDVYGRTRNPHAAQRSPGGSSGGESAALAARLSPLGIGSDLGSSIRQPAAWTGVFGLKPTRGLVPLGGHAGFGVPLAWQLFATIGPLARGVGDLGTGPAHPRRPRVARGLDQAAARRGLRGRRPAAGGPRLPGRGARAARPPSPPPVTRSSTRHRRTSRRPRVYDDLLVTELRVAGWPALAGREDELSEYGRRATAGTRRLHARPRRLRRVRAAPRRARGGRRPLAGATTRSRSRPSSPSRLRSRPRASSRPTASRFGPAAS